MLNKLIRIALIILLVAGLSAVFVYRDQLDASVLENWVSEAGMLGSVLFMLIYALGTVLFFPGSVLTLAGGAFFGPVYGTFYNLTGATLGAAFSFLTAKYLLSDWVEKKTGGKAKQLKDGVENEGWRFVAFVRLVPLFPFNVLNYALGLTRIKFWHYVITSYICMFPGAVAYTYLGYIGKEAATGGSDLIQKSLLALALLAMAGFLPRLIAILRRGPMMDVDSLKKILEQGEDILLLDVRTENEFHGEQGHIENAVNIPLEQLSDRLSDVRDFSNKAVAIVCRTDKRSARAAQVLAKNGFSDVHIVKQGMTDWNKRNYSVIK